MCDCDRIIKGNLSYINNQELKSTWTNLPRWHCGATENIWTFSLFLFLIVRALTRSRVSKSRNRIKERKNEDSEKIFFVFLMVNSTRLTFQNKDRVSGRDSWWQYTYVLAGKDSHKAKENVVINQSFSAVHDQQAGKLISLWVFAQVQVKINKIFISHGYNRRFRVQIKVKECDWTDFFAKQATNKRLMCQLQTNQKQDDKLK